MSYFKKVSVFIFVLLTVQLRAQDFPYYYFTTISPMANNPSLAGINDKINADFTVYNLWASGFKPVTDYIVSFSMAPDFKKRKQQSRNQPWVGLGASLLKERVGAFNQVIFQAIYAYHIPLSRTSQLSFGICGMVENISIDVNSLTPIQVGDPRLTNGNNSATIIDGGFGTTYQDKNLQVSFSALNLMPGVFQFENSQAESISSYRKFFLSGSYTLKLTEKTSIQPDFTLRNSIQKDLYYDASIKFDLHYLSLGIGYRSENSIFIYTQIPFHSFVFSYCSENPMQSTYMIGKGHTFSLSWSMKKLK
jgi:type IX secretion system PorP/SprF family membrane protein